LEAEHLNDILHNLLYPLAIPVSLYCFCVCRTDLKKMKATQCSDNVSPFSLNDHFVCVFSNLGWLYYGLLKGDGTVIIVNVIGATLQTLYIITYCHYTKEKVCHLVSVMDFTVGSEFKTSGFFLPFYLI